MINLGVVEVTMVSLLLVIIISNNHSMALSPRISTTTLRWRRQSLTQARTAMSPIRLSMWLTAVMPRLRWNIAMTPRLQ